MTECEQIQDRMPDVARGLASWSDGERAHLASCPDCSLAWRVVQGGAGLQMTTVVDAGRIADAVRSRLREMPDRVPAIRRIPWRGVVVGAVAIAASAVLVLAGSHSRPGAAAFASDSGALAVLPELQALNDVELESILQSLGPSAADATPGVVPHLEELTDSELEQLLRTGEGE